MAQEEMVIMTRSFDFLSWLLPATNHFPRAHRHTFTQRLLDAAFDLREHLEAAHANGSVIAGAAPAWPNSRPPTRTWTGCGSRHRRALGDLRLAARWNWLSGGQYRHVAGMVNEIGRLLGGWQKTTRKSQ